MKEAFIYKNFSQSNINKIALVNSILDDYYAQGYDLSLRQLYYQLVARGYIENSTQSYKKLGSLVNNARLAGEVDWNMIVDRSRAQIKRDIEDGKPTDYRKIQNGKHWISKKEADSLYMLR